MSKTVIALYNDFEAARNAVEALVDAGFDRSDISLVAKDADERFSRTLKNRDVTDDGDVKSGQGAGFGAVVGALVGLGVALIPGVGPVLAAGPLAAVLFGGIGAAAGAATGGIVAGLVDLGVPEEDAQQYAEGINRGGALVSVDLDSDEHVSRAESILNRYNPINIDERGEFNRTGTSANLADTQPRIQSQGNDFRNTSRSVNPGEQQKLNVVEEQVQVGKREVEGGTVRVHTRVTERPVEEQVTLHDERVTVERHPVDRAANPADLNTFQEGTIEVTERHEEPVVSKTARVVEEVVVGKEAQDRTETVRETVRRKDVEVEGAQGTAGMTGGYADYETRFRNNFNTNYASSGSTWESYSPAYRYGYDLASDQRYQDWSWDRMESDARTRWESTNPNSWDRFKQSIHDAFDEVRGRR